jgi:hypothetical protein
MTIECSRCRKDLHFNQAQRAKLDAALAKLKKEESLTIKCPHCLGAVSLRGTVAEVAETGSVHPPEPPSIDWLKTGIGDGEDKLEDVPMAMVLCGDLPQRAEIVESIKSVGYQVVVADTHQDAMERMQFVNFSCVVFHIEFEKAGLPSSTFHNYMRKMNMGRRRYIFYIIIGPDIHTLWELESLTASANLTVCEKDLKYFDVILRKAIPSYEELFAPLLEELTAFGKI